MPSSDLSQGLMALGPENLRNITPRVSRKLCFEFTAMAEYDDQEGMDPTQLAGEVAAALSSPNITFFGQAGRSCRLS